MVKTAEGYSGHSDRPQVNGIFKKFKTNSDNVLTMHGDWSKTEELANAAAMMLRRNGLAMQNLESLRLR